MAGCRNGAGAARRRSGSRYRARIADNADWGRPDLVTARKIGALVGVNADTMLRMPKDPDGDTAARAFVVALDYVISLGDQSEEGAQLTFTGLFGALARYWSLAYRDAMSRGAMVPYDMSEATLTGRDGAWREVQVAGVNVEAIWELLRRQTAVRRPVLERQLDGLPIWARVIRPGWRPGEWPHEGLSQLYVLTRVGGVLHPRGRRVRLIEGPLLDAVRQAILDDSQYRRPERRRLLLADEHAPALLRRQKTCEERPYDVVHLGERSRDVLAILESSRVQFHVSQFRKDCEASPDLKQAFRSVYERTAGITDDVVVIRSRFFRALNRRFNAEEFWPEHVPKQYRSKWFSPAAIHVHGYIDADRYIDEEMLTDFVVRDISSSQTQILSVFLGEPELEALATSRTVKFKCYLAQQLWAFHESELGCSCGSGDVHAPLTPGYAGPDDERLVEFIKEIWMRRNYGGKFGETVQDLADSSEDLVGEQDTYGPGWNANVHEPGGVRAATRYFEAFLRTLPPWIGAINTFLKACEYIGRHADSEGGVVFADPLDGAPVQWNPIKRAIKSLPAGSNHLEANLSGRSVTVSGRKKFTPPPWRVDDVELSRRVAPCLVHALDAYFNALVLEYLHYIGVDEIIAVHDAWFVPREVETILQDDDTGAFSGSAVLDWAIDYVGQEWLSGVGRVPDPDKPLYYSMTNPDAVVDVGLGRERLGPPSETRPGLGVVYDWFVGALKGSDFEQFALNIRVRWRERVVAERWPTFTAS